MQTYYYAIWLLMLSVVMISSRSFSRSIDNEQNDDVSDPNNNYDYVYAPYSLAQYLNNPLAFETHEEKLNHKGLSFERQRKAIRKGDPREFMG